MLNVLPMGVGSFLSTRLWSVGGKLRLLKEPFIKKALTEESIAEFVARRLGKEFLDYAINPFVAGVYAGSPEKLSVRFAFPKLYALEAQYGGLMKGTIKSRSERKKRKEIAKDRARLFSFSNGMQTLPNRLAEVLGDSLRLSTHVDHIIPMRAGRYPKYTISITHNAIRTSVEADVVVLSTPAYAASNIIRPIDPEMASMLDAVYYPPVAEIFLGFKHEQIRRRLDGFGFLVPEVEKKNILGCIWSSSLFPNRAPNGYAALTSFVGGSREPELVSYTDEKLTEIVMNDLRSMMGIDGMPALVKIVRWNRAIPQYNVGYGTTIKAIERFEQSTAGLLDDYGDKIDVLLIHKTECLTFFIRVRFPCRMSNTFRCFPSLPTSCSVRLPNSMAGAGGYIITRLALGAFDYGPPGASFNGLFDGKMGKRER